MKGLFIKELYLLKKHCGGYALAIAVFIILSLMGNDSVMVIIYPGTMAALIPIMLLSHDEKSKWNQYCGTLPYSKAQLVSVKYLISLFTQIIVLFLSGLTQAFIMTQQNSVRMDIYLLKMSLAFITPFVLSSVSLPLIFKLGAEKGQIVFSLIMGLICAVLIPLTMAAPSLIAQEFPSTASLSVWCLIALAIYALSWRLSIALYMKKETS